MGPPDFGVMDPPDIVPMGPRPEPLFDPDRRVLRVARALGAERQCTRTRITSPGKPNSSIGARIWRRKPDLPVQIAFFYPNVGTPSAHTAIQYRRGTTRTGELDGATGVDGG